jgi:hypothetical protein
MNKSMACTTCGTAGSTKGVHNASNSCDNNMEWTCGTFANGAQTILHHVLHSLSVAGFKAPNIIQFNEDPSLLVGDRLILNNTDVVTTLRGLTQNVAVTGAPTLVAGLYEVATDLVLTGGTSVTLQTVAASVYCDPGSVAAAKSITADVLAPAPNLANFSGYVYSRPLNSPSVSGCVFVVNGSSRVTIKDASFNVKKGDKLFLDQTGIVGANAATVIDISTGRAANGDRVFTLELDRVVTGVTAIAPVGQLPQVTATAKAQIVAPITFTSNGNYEVYANVDKALTSSPNFPPGTRVEAASGNCEGQAYCYSMNVAFPGNSLKSIYGTLVLR